MAELPAYQDLEEKRRFFSNGNKDSFIIKTKKDLDLWFKDVNEAESEETNVDATALIYRGVTEAKYKLLTSAQRLWISDEMHQWVTKSYMDFVGDLVVEFGKSELIKKVFDLYNYSESDRHFPILSLLQHYGAPTPLIDWSYNSNVAFFFATYGLKKSVNLNGDIDNYFSVYKINKRQYRSELLNIVDFNPEYRYPDIQQFSDFGDNEGRQQSNSVFYISDFERPGESLGKTKPYKRLIVRTPKPLTSVFNQNIIPQEGLFIFNPFSTKPLESIFMTDGWNLALTPFECFNIHKDLAGYLRRKIKVKNEIDEAFVYPELKRQALKVKENVLDHLI